MASPKPAEVRVQLRRICSYGKFRGRKAKRLLAFLVKEAIAQRGSKLRLQYIAEALKDEPLTFEKDTQKWGYPKTRANLAHVRKRLREYYETKGYYDPVIIKLTWPGARTASGWPRRLNAARIPGTGRRWRNWLGQRRGPDNPVQIASRCKPRVGQMVLATILNAKGTATD
jgi:hypothetical protein